MIKYKKFTKTNHITFFSKYKVTLAEAGNRETEEFKALHDLIQTALYKFEDNKEEDGKDINHFLYGKIVLKIWDSHLSTDNKIRMIDYYDLNEYIPKCIEQEATKAWENLSDRLRGVKTKTTLESVVSVNCSFCNPTYKCIIQ